MAAKLLPYSLLTVATLSGFEYTTHYEHPKDHNLPYILFTHGFPSSAYDWRHQVEYFSNKGYGIIAPDTLGYGSSDTPTDFHSYRLKTVVDSIIEVVDKVAGPKTKVVGVAHDWGAALQSRMANYHPDRFLSYTFLTPYVPSGPFDVNAINAASLKTLGYTSLGYWPFFNASDSGSIIDSHKTQFADLLYPANMSIWKQYFAPIGSTQAWLQNGSDVAHAPYVTNEEQNTHNEIFAKSGYTPGLCYYKSIMSDINLADEAAIPTANKTTNSPTLFIGSTADPLLVFAQSVQLMQSFAKDVIVKNVSAGHWSQLERREEVNHLIEQFVKEQSHH